MKKRKIHVVWFKRDLRLFDNIAFSGAAENGNVLPLYIFEPELWKQSDHSYRHFVFMKEAIENLDNQLKKLGSNLVCLVGSAVSIFNDLNSIYNVTHIWSHQETGNLWSYERDKCVRSWATASGVQWVERTNNGVIRNLQDRSGWSQKWYAAMSAPVVPVPKKLNSVQIASHSIPTPESLKLSLDQPVSHQRAKRSDALRTLESFLQIRGHNYTFEMSSPVTAEESCSRISPYLAFGQISVREAFQITEKRTQELRGVDTKFLKSLKSFSSRLRWHCHFIQKLEDQPSIENKTLHSSFENLRPRSCDHQILEAWEKGMTGYPMIDACMRYLNKTGWLNFRMRAMLVSFASYHLWLDWRLTSKHLARQFLDYEPGIHYSQIQMQSGTTGMNAIRIYNPIKQGMDQDPDGKFIRKWVPELEDIPAQFIHQPWLFENDNESYPKPIVDEKLARTRAKEKIYALKKESKKSDETAKLILKHASRSKRKTRKNKVSKKMPAETVQLRLNL